VYRAWVDRETLRLHEDWERTRTQAFVFAQPYLKKGTTVHKMFPLPWDNKGKKPPKKSTRERFEELKEKYASDGIDNQHNVQAPGEREGPQGADQ
jgi:hypothetical protein